MYTNSVIRVLRKATFDDLMASTKTEGPLEVLWEIADQGFETLLMEEIFNNITDPIPMWEDVLDNYKANYLDYMASCYARADCANYGRDDNMLATLVIDAMTFDDIRYELNQLSDKTAFENVRLVRKHTTKEHLMRLIFDRIEPDSIPDMETIANIINSVTDKYLDTNSIWN